MWSANTEDVPALMIEASGILLVTLMGTSQVCGS